METVLDLFEAVVLEKRVGEEFNGVVTSVRDDERSGVVLLEEIGVEAPVASDQKLPLGEETKVRLTSVDVAARKVAFTLA